jgi:hypothetical protein
MTSSSRIGLLLLSALLGAARAWAGLGEPQGAIDNDRARMHAHHAVAQAQQYAVHDLKMADGSLVQQYVAANGRVFAVRWNTLYKPDLSALLGASFPAYASAAQQAARHGGIQRQFHHEAGDLVLHSAGHLQVFSGYAYRRSLLPRGLNLQHIGLGQAPP